MDNQIHDMQRVANTVSNQFHENIVLLFDAHALCTRPNKRDNLYVDKYVSYVKSRKKME